MQEARIQISFHGAGGTLINLRADSIDELNAGLRLLDQKAAEVQAVAESLGTDSLKTAVDVAQAVLGATPVEPAPTPQADPWATAQPAPQPVQPPAAPPSQTGPSCVHGPMEFKSGISTKTGREWKAWTCSANACKRQWIN